MKNRSTGRLGGLFNVVIPECFYRGSQPYEKTTRFPITTFGNDVRRGPLRGFTLIELLVVVLIIGILSAIALPQYRKAVFRTRMTEVLVNWDIIKKAVQIAGLNEYYGSGTYLPRVLQVAGFDLNGGTWEAQGAGWDDRYYSMSNWYWDCSYSYGYPFPKPYVHCGITPKGANTGSVYRIHLYYTVGGEERKQCTYKSNDSAQKAVCDSLKGDGFRTLASS